MSEPVLGGSPPNQNQVPEAYSVGPGDGQNRVAQAGNAAAHHVEAGQSVGKSRREEELHKLVAEEKASRSKFPRYPGLERWELLEKMGDGAFSNVYRARDLRGDSGEVAIKVVRKFEMNSMQVREMSIAGAGHLSSYVLFSPSPFPFDCISLSSSLPSFVFSSSSLPTPGMSLGQPAYPSRFQAKSPKGCRGARINLLTSDLSYSVAADKVLSFFISFSSSMSNPSAVTTPGRAPGAF